MQRAGHPPGSYGEPCKERAPSGRLEAGRSAHVPQNRHLSGKTWHEQVSFQERQDRMANFTSDPEQFCFLLSTRAGGAPLPRPRMLPGRSRLPPVRVRVTQLGRSPTGSDLPRAERARRRVSRRASGAGLGISLPVADTVIFYDSDFNPQQDLQERRASPVPWRSKRDVQPGLGGGAGLRFLRLLSSVRRSGELI